MRVSPRLSGLCFTLSCPGSAQWGKTGSFSPAGILSIMRPLTSVPITQTQQQQMSLLSGYYRCLWFSPHLHPPPSYVFIFLCPQHYLHAGWKTLNLKAWWKSLFQMKASSTKPHKVPLTVLASDFPVFYICVLFSPWLSVTAPRLTICGSSPVKKCWTEELHFLMNDKLQFWDAWPQTHKVLHPEQSIPLDTIACWDMSSDFPS